jgi:Na+-driven multidrug efflux pump
MLLLGTLRLFFPSLDFLKFFAAGLIPALSNNLIPLFYTGQLPDQSGLALAAQFTFVGVILEVISEGIGNSLYFFIGRNYKEKRREALGALKLCLLILFLLGSALTLAILFLTPHFVSLINTPPALAAATERFLWTSAFAFPLDLLNQALVKFFFISTSSLLIPALLINTLSSFLINFFFFGQQGASLHWGIGELGLLKVITASVHLLTNFAVFFAIERIGPMTFLRLSFRRDLRRNLRDLSQVSWGNFGDSAIRNLFYFFVTLKFINALGETEVGAWSLLNNIIWGLLLIPSNTVADYIKVIQYGGRACFCTT